MNAPPQDFERLTNAERECLRLVHQGFGSKEIADRRGISADRVDKIIKAARAKLGGLTRREAARLFVEWEARQPKDELPGEATQKLGAQSLGLDRDPQSLLHRAPDMPERVTDAGSGPGKAEPPRSLDRNVPHGTIPGEQGSRRNVLDRLPRLVVILLIAALGVFTAGAALSLLFVLDHLVSGW